MERERERGRAERVGVRHAVEGVKVDEEEEWR